MVDTKIILCGITLDNPIIPASGTFGFGYEFNQYYDINILGSIALKGTTVEARYGNPLPRIAEGSDGIINSVGLQNPGVDKVINEELPRLNKIYQKKVIANISGFSLDEYVLLAKKFDACPEVGWIEVNLSCPNVHGGGMSFGLDASSIKEITKAVKEVTHKPIIIKLSPNVTDIVSLAKAAEDSGADAVALVNTFLAMRIDLKSKKPILANTYGGYSGPAIFPIALRMVHQVAKAIHIPVIGIGGISTAEDVLEMLLAGATAVEIGAANLINPYACKEIIESLPNAMNKYRITSLIDIIGGAK